MSYQGAQIQGRVDVDNLFSSYAYMIDDGDASWWIGPFVEDGVFDVPGLNRFEGPEGLRSGCSMVIEASQGN